MNIALLIRQMERQIESWKGSRQTERWTGSRPIIRSGRSCLVIARPSSFCCTLQHRHSTPRTVALVMTHALKTHADTPFCITGCSKSSEGQRSSDEYRSENECKLSRTSASAPTSHASSLGRTGASGRLLHRHCCCRWQKNLICQEMPKCKRHHTFTETGVTLRTRPRSNCKSDYEARPQTSFPSAQDKPPS